MKQYRVPYGLHDTYNVVNVGCTWLGLIKPAVPLQLLQIPTTRSTIVLDGETDVHDGKGRKDGPWTFENKPIFQGQLAT
jgi:hypothetical protein